MSYLSEWYASFEDSLPLEEVQGQSDLPKQTRDVIGEACAKLDELLGVFAAAKMRRRIGDDAEVALTLKYLKRAATALESWAKELGQDVAATMKQKPGPSKVIL